MPSFPPISTLSQKLHLTGEEEIQISATEKTTLAELVSQLGFSIQSILTGLNNSLTPGIGIPTEEDTLITALAKLIARAGGNRLFIMPAPSDTMEDPNSSIPKLSLIILTDTFDQEANVAGYIGGLEFTETGISLRLFSYEEPIVGDYSSIVDLYNYVQQSSPAYWWGYTNDKEEVVSTDRITFNPNSVIFHDGNSITSLIMPIYYWAQDSSGHFSQYTSTIVTRVNVTKAMFNEASGGLLSGITYLFMDGFDDNPGTEFQCITIQRVRRINTYSEIVLLVNKCGYSRS